MEKKVYVSPLLEAVPMQASMVICASPNPPEPLPGRKDMF